ncbi:MAG: alpha-L-fucosidase [Mariniphaga sp.]|nr:alpha-L-fucosidase [Mariniphaga sp.]
MKNYIFILILFVFFMSCSSNKKDIIPKYEPTWESLAQHNEEPQWFQDAKFGIYFHWGVYSVPAFGSEWYPRSVNYEGGSEYKYHVEKYGNLSKFGYHDFVPMFKAENFDAKEWADLFAKAGARFAGPVAEHHDGFSMWASKVTPWNTFDKGPKRDITGELEKEIRANGMKLITTFHHARNLQRYKGKEEEEMAGSDNIRMKFWNSHYPLFEGTPQTLDDPKLNYLYGNIPEEKWLEEVWFGKLKEVIDNYQPDIIWFDSWLDQIPEEYRQKFCAYYLNEAEKLGKEVVIIRKQNDLPLETTVDDLEKSRKNRLEEKSWMTDETLSKGSWCYTQDLEIKETTDVLHVLIDIVSKNGVLLLNISPMANGTIPENQRRVLLEIGEWLNKYGEAIYETRPWYTYGEGPTIEPEGNFENHQEFLKIKYSEKDIRYTTKGKIIYATILGNPGTNQKILLEAFAKNKLIETIEIKKVSIPGNSSAIDFNITENGLVIQTNDNPDDEMAVVFKIEIK